MPTGPLLHCLRSPRTRVGRRKMMEKPEHTPNCCHAWCQTHRRAFSGPGPLALPD